LQLLSELRLKNLLFFKKPRHVIVNILTYWVLFQG
jgi:hypothetical protein